MVAADPPRWGAPPCRAPSSLGVPKIPKKTLKPHALIYGAGYNRMMEAFGGTGLLVENPKD
jgi:2-hydroxyacyl-CoA lyase 1